MRVVAGRFSPSRVEQTGLFAQCEPGKRPRNYPHYPHLCRTSDNLEGIGAHEGVTCASSELHSPTSILCSGMRLTTAQGLRSTPSQAASMCLGSTPSGIKKRGYAGPRGARAVRGGRPARCTAAAHEISGA